MNENEWMNGFHSDMQPFNHPNDGSTIWFWLCQVMIY